MSGPRRARPANARYDVVVAGGGPAGAAVATLLGRRGHRVLLAERSAEPQFKVGESLMPATYWTLARLGVLEAMKASAFPAKKSVQFVGASGRASVPFYFHEFNPHESSSTWQVLRSEFDQLLLDNAAGFGVEVRRGLAVERVLFEGERAVGARLRPAEGETVDVGARVVVDATGQSALVARDRKLRVIEPRLRNASFFTHYEGARLDSGIDAGATIIFHTAGHRSWFWFIPLPGERVSVGVVGEVDHMIRGRASDPGRVFDEELARCPALGERLAGARQVMEVKAIRDFSYHSREIAGHGWVLVGDAYGFIDPIYSTGVFLALASGEMAADAIHEALDDDDLSGARLGSFGPQLRSGVEALRKLVYAFYEPSFSFADFLRRHPDCREQLVHMLVGNVFRERVDGLLAALDETLGAESGRTVETAS